MKNKKIICSILSLIILISSNVLHASVIRLVPLANVFLVGDSISIDVQIDFSDNSTLGGGIDISFDQTFLSYQSFEFNSGFPFDPFFSNSPTILNNELDALAFGNLDGFFGQNTVGTLFFTALMPGISSLTLAETDNALWAGGFEGRILDLQGASVQINAVPIPAAFWLLLSGMVVLGAVVRRPRSKFFRHI